MKWVRKIGAASLVIGVGALTAYGFELSGIQTNMLGGLCGAGAVMCLMYL